jgi:PAS domain S-box-containing protein
MSLLGAARYFNFRKINNYPAIHLTLYHILIGAGIIFLAPIGSNYVFVWLIILFLTNFFFGLKATIGSGMVLALVLELQLLWNASKLENGIVGSDITVVLAQLGITFAVAMFFVDTQSVSDQDRHLLVTSMDKAQLERQRLVSLINSMVDAVIATDEQGAVKLYNAASLNMLDTNEDLTGKQIQNYMKLVNDKKQPVDFLTLTGEGASSFHSRDLTLGTNDDERMNISISISPIKLGFRRDSERGYIITFRDITREKSLEEERDEFISVISHELRTPVAITEANISNAIFMAENKKDSAQTLDSLKAAHKQALFLAGLLNDLSTLSRAEKGKLDHTFEKLDPRELIDDLMRDYANEAKSKGLKLKKQVAKSAPQEIISNRLYVKEILQNFITNAIKYTHEGTVTVSLDSKNNATTAVFSVTDSGIGISKSDQKKIFDKFYRSEDFRTRESSGTGLGLYITKKLASILDAKFEVTSKLNEGSTFSVIIPSQEPTETKDTPK